MLRELRVRDLVVIDALDVAFGPGLNVLTGETGAGKSLVIDAILLVRGARAHADLVRAGADSATVQAILQIGPASPVPALLEDAGLPRGDDGELVIRREVSRTGRHRAFVNDAAVTVGFLERLGDHLVEVHGQHEHQRLLEPAHQLELLDRFADAEPLRERVATLVAKHRAAQEAVQGLQLADRERAQREDLLRFQVTEIEAAQLRAGEEDELRTELGRLKHAERLAGALGTTHGLLADDEEAVKDRLARATRVLEAMVRIDPGFAGPLARLAAASAEVDEAVHMVRTLRDTLVFDPGRRDAIGDRLDVIGRLKRKYGESEAAVVAAGAAATEELARLEHHEEVLAAETRVLEDLAAKRGEAAAALTALRREAAQRLATRVQRELRTLGMERAVFEIAIEPLPAAAVGPRGADRVEVRLAANPGEEARPLARVASGGELSRTMLALLAVLAAADPVATMIFDEVDAGIGARAAGAVADKLAAVARDRQVICVTHQTAIAARAQQHLRLAKQVRAGRTRVAASVLEGDDRVREIARMLSGDTAGPAAVQHARALLDQG